MSSWSDDPFYLVSLGVHKSRRYHSKMGSFFQLMSDVVLGSNSILGASAFIALLGGRDGLVAKVLIGIVAVASAIDNVFGFSRKAKLHADLCRKFTELAAKMATWDANDDNYKKAVSERIMIEKDEPPVQRLIDIAARNEEMRSLGYPPNELAPLSWAQRTFGYVFTFDMGRLEAWHANKQSNSCPKTPAAPK